MNQEQEFEELFNLYWKYVYKYEVGHPDDFNPNKPHYKRDEFRQQLYEEGMTIKISEGY